MANNSGVVGVLRALLTADTASFDTGMRKAATTAETTTTAIKGLGTQVEKLSPQAERMVKALGGEKLLAAANNLTAAVARIGGAAKLTETQQARVNATVTQAIQKYAVLGKTAPQAMLDLQRATMGVQTSTVATSSQVSKLTNQLAGLFTVRAVLSFGERVIAAGDHIQKMSDQTGLATDEVQRFDFIAGQTGTTVESLIGAVQNLQQRLGDDSTGAAGAFKKLGINADEFNKLGVYQQMITLASALRAIKDPTDQASIAAALFGKTWKEILPAIKADMQALGEQAPLMADETVKSLDRIGDALTKARQQWLVWGGSVAEAIEKFGFFLGGGFGAELTMKKWAEENDPTGLGRALGAIPPVAEQATRGLKTLSMSAEEAERIEKKLTASAKESITEHERLAAAVAKLTAIRERYLGLDAVAEAREMVKAIGGLAGVTHGSAESMRQLNLLMIDAIDAAKRNGKDVPLEWLRIEDATRDNIGSLQEYLKLVGDLPEAMREIPEPPELLPTSALDEERLRNKLLGVLPSVKPEMATQADGVGKDISERLVDAMEDIPHLITSSLLHSGGFLNGLKALGVRMADAIVEPLIKQFIAKIAAARFASMLAGLGTAGSAATAIASTAATGATTAAAGGTSAAGATGAGIGLSAGAIATTAGIAGAGIAAYYLWRHYGRGGQRGNDNRDKFLAQFAAADLGKRDANNPPGFYGLDRLLTNVKRHDLFEALIRATGAKDIRKAEEPIAALMASMGRPVKTYQLGGFTPPNTIDFSVNHGGRLGEWHIPGEMMAKSSIPAQKQTPNVYVTVTNHIKAIDATGVREFVESPAYLHSLGNVIERNTGFIATRIERSTQR